MKPPDDISESSKQIWVDIELNANRTLYRADYAIIENFCRELDLYDQAVAKIQEGDFENKHNQVTPAVTVRNQAANNIRQLYKSISKFLKQQEPVGSNLKSVKNF